MHTCSRLQLQLRFSARVSRQHGTNILSENLRAFGVCSPVLVAVVAAFYFMPARLMFTRNVVSFAEPVNEIRSHASIHLGTGTSNKPICWRWSASAVQSDTQNGKLKHFMSKVEIAIYLEQMWAFPSVSFIRICLCLLFGETSLQRHLTIPFIPYDRETQML